MGKQQQLRYSNSDNEVIHLPHESRIEVQHPPMTVDLREKKRRINRLSARRSRAREKVMLDVLENRAALLAASNRRLKDENMRLMRSLKTAAGIAQSVGVCPAPKDLALPGHSNHVLAHNNTSAPHLPSVAACQNLMSQLEQAEHARHHIISRFLSTFGPASSVPVPSSGTLSSPVFLDPSALQLHLLGTIIQQSQPQPRSLSSLPPPQQLPHRERGPQSHPR